MPESRPAYGGRKAEAQFARVFEAAQCRTQNELAEILDIQQSSISDAKRRGSVPSDWLVKLLRLRGVNPDWILQGAGSKYLTPSGASATGESPCADLVRAVDADKKGRAGMSLPPCADLVRAVDADTVRKVLRCFPLHDLVSELWRRKWTPDKDV